MSNGNNQGKVVSLEQITDLIGVDPIRVDRSSAALNAALEKIQKENADKAQSALETEVRELVTLVQGKNKIEQEFKGKVAEADKKIAKIYNRLKGVKENKPVVEEEEKKDDVAAA